MQTKFFFIFLMITFVQFCFADIYISKDAEGNSVFTSFPVPGGKIYLKDKNNNSVKNSESSPRTTTSKTTSVGAPSPVNFPRVDAATQKSRDSNRKQILTDELNSEQASLNAAKKALQDAESTKSAEEKANPKLYLDRIGRLRETIVMHEKNTAALQAELSRMR